MLDVSHIPVSTGIADVQTFTGDAIAVGTAWKTWTKPRGKSMLHISLVGAGGNGGTGVVGANSTAGGGAGGQSGAITSLIVPLWFLPDTLFLSLSGRKPTATANFASLIAIAPVNTANNILAFANGGLHGGNASAGTGGTVGTAAAIATAANMPLGWPFITSVSSRYCWRCCCDCGELDAPYHGGFRHRRNWWRWTSCRCRYWY